jgi:hypothetical protein
MDAAMLDRQVDRQLDALGREFADIASATRVSAIGRGYADRLNEEATINDFIPVLVYRFTRAELVRVREEELHRAA